MHDLRQISITENEGGSDDELSLLAVTQDSVQSVSAPLASRRRSLRARGSLSNGSVAKLKQEAKKSINKRTLSTSVIEERGPKRQKMDDGKVSIRDDIANHRNRWYYQHRDLLRPLLHTGSAFVDNLERAFRQQEGTTTAYIPLHDVDEQPKFIKGGTMKDYQLHGLSFLVWMYKNGMNALLGDEMGLGKTLQTLSLFAYIKESSTVKLDPHLVICPLSVLSSWETETIRWLPGLLSFRYHGTAPERTRLKTLLAGGEHKYEIVLTTYEAYLADADWFKGKRWGYCVLDEGHKIKNPDTNIAQAVQGISSLYRLLLTGTPVQNNLSELWGLLHWLYPTVFTQASERVFKQAFDLTKGTYDLDFVSSAKSFLSTIMLRRTKAVVEVDVPPKEELTVFIPLSELQRFWMLRLLTRLDTANLDRVFGSETKVENSGEMLVLEPEGKINATAGASSGNNGDWKRLMNLLMQLRKVCDHPYLLPNAEPSPYYIGEHVVEASSKIVVIDKLLADILPTGERVLIFTQWTGMLDLLEDFMMLRDITYARLDGSTCRPRRTFDIKLFQQEKSPYKVFLISTKAGGLGINLTKANHVIMCDSDWNPQNDLQAIARAHRINQDKIVKVYRLICRASVEDQMLDRIRRKLFLSFKVMSSNPDSTSADNSTGSLGSNELMDILRKGSSALTSSDDDMSLAQFLQAPLKDILDVSRKRDEVREAKMKFDAEGVQTDKMKDVEEEERRLLSGVAQVRSRLFEGKMVMKYQNNEDIAKEWKDTETKKRERIDNTVLVNGTICVQRPILSALSKLAPKAVIKGPSWEHEDSCIWCRDGGTLNMCAGCPRVYHTNCYDAHMDPALSKNRTTYLARCSQHSCTECGRSTAEAGGMLFRCQTCSQAFCEDCLPPGEIDAVGETLPEFSVLGYEAKAAAYFIKCHGCQEHFEQNPDEWAIWEKEMLETNKKLEAMTA